MFVTGYFHESGGQWCHGSGPCMGQGHASCQLVSSMLLVIYMHLTHNYDYMFTFTLTKNKLNMLLLVTPIGMPGPYRGS